MGMSLNKKGDLGGAIKNFYKALEINPRHAGAYINLGNIYSERLDFLPAIKHYKSAIRINPNFPDTYYNLAATFERIKDFSNSLKYYKLSFQQNSQEIKSLTKIRLLSKK